MIGFLCGLPIVFGVLIFLVSQLAEPYPGVSPLVPLVGWQIPGDGPDDPQALAILEIARSSEEFGDRPLWLYHGDRGLLLMTPISPGINGPAGRALADTPVDTNTIIMYTGAYGFVLEDAVQSFQEDPVAFVDSVRHYVPWVLGSSSIGFLLAGWWFRRKRPVAGWDRSPGERLAAHVAIGLGVTVGLGGLLAASIVGWITVTLLGIESAEVPLFEMLADSGGLVVASFLLLAAVIAPLGEEMFFRGHIFRWSADRCSLAFAYVLSATLFAAIHGNPPGIPSYLVVGLILAWAYERWRTLLVPMVAHGTYNAVAIAFMVWA